MTLFRLQLRGENFPLRVEGEQRLMGFHAIRFVEAEDRIEAATKALAILKGEPELVAVPAGCGATLTYEEIVEAEPAERPTADRDLAFFAMAERA